MFSSCLKDGKTISKIDTEDVLQERNFSLLTGSFQIIFSAASKERHFIIIQNYISVFKDYSNRNNVKN